MPRGIAGGVEPQSLTPVPASVLFVLLVAGLVGFALFGVTYDHDPLAALDRENAEWVARGMPSWAEWLARPLSWVGGWMGLVPISVGLVALLLVAGRVLDALWVALTLAGIHVVTPLLKEAFDRPRPDQGSAVPLPSSDSFPSGHASGAVVTFGVLATMCVERWPDRARLLWSAAVALVVAIGVSRTVLNVHYVTDVLGGWYLGLAWFAAALLVHELLRLQAAPASR